MGERGRSSSVILRLSCVRLFCRVLLLKPTPFVALSPALPRNGCNLSLSPRDDSVYRARSAHHTQLAKTMEG